MKEQVYDKNSKYKKCLYSKTLISKYTQFSLFFFMHQLKRKDVYLYTRLNSNKTIINFNLGVNNFDLTKILIGLGIILNNLNKTET